VFVAPVPSHTRYWLPKDRWWEWLFFSVSGVGIYDWGVDLTQRFGHTLPFSSSGPFCQRLVGLFNQLARENALRPTLISSEIYAICMALEEEQTSSHPSDDPIQNALARLESNFSDPRLDVSLLAHEAGMSRAHFSRRFKGEIGVPPGTRLEQIRIGRATLLLQQSDLSVREIAEACGYRSASYFGAAFKKHTGKTPGALRS
ncbi:MAG: helix-turn-helix domain-containing protein, partial [Planctomycetota bacterium]